MTFLNHNNNLSLVTLHFPSSTSPPSSAASPSSTSSTGWTDKIAKKIDELKKQQNDLNKLKEAKNGYLPEQDSKSLDSLPTQLTSLETVQKLAEFAESLTKKPENDNVLTHLCDGLETFLGFNSDSKGYTGTGIVYSDLDRLCDAVMGFLSGVLSNIKEHLGQHKDEINNAVNILNEKKHAGKEGFNAAIGSVVEGVRGYNTAVLVSNNNVKKVIEKLQKDVGETFLKSVNNVLAATDNKNKPITYDDKQVKQAVDQINMVLESCQENVKTFNKAVDMQNNTDEMKKAINDLNSDLKNRLENVRRTVAYESERLGRVKELETEELNKTIEKIAEVMSTLKVDVDCNIREDVKKFVDALKRKVTPIKKNLEKITKDLSQYVIELDSWMEAAKKDINEIREEDVQRILNEITDGVTDKTYLIKEDAKTLTEKSEELDNVIKSTKEKLARLVQKALEQVVILDRAVRGDLERLKGALQLQLRTYVKDNMLKGIITRVGEIVRGEKGDGLEGIVNKVKKYAQVFQEEETFKQKVLETFLDEILHKEPVTARLEQYVIANSSHFKEPYDSIKSTSDPALFRALKKVIIEELKSNVENAFSAFSIVNEHGSVAAHVGIAKGICLNFATQLGNKLKDDAAADFFDNTAGAIAQELTQNKLNTDNHIQYAVGAILYQLVGVARKTGESLGTFTHDDGGSLRENVAKRDIDKVDAALKAADGLERELQTATSLQIVDRYNTITPGTEFNLTDFVEGRIAGIVDAEIGKTDTRNGRVTISDVSNFSTYLRSLNTSKLSANSNPTGTKEEGQLPESIGAIKGEADSIYITHITSGLTALSEKIKQDLHTITKAITASANLVKDKLLKFRDNRIGNAAKYTEIKPNTLQAIHDKLDKLQGPVSEALKGATDLLDNYLERADKYYTELISDHVKKDIQKATDKLTTHARKTYVESIKFLLTEFAGKVTRELSELPREIDEDLEKGHKKFMSTFEEIFVRKVKEIGTIDTKSSTKETYPLGKGAEKLKKAFEKFIEALQDHEDVTSCAPHVQNAYKYLNDLLKQIRDAHHFDHAFTIRQKAFQETLTAFAPETFADAAKSLLCPLKTGLQKFVEIMDTAYINSYEGSAPIDQWVTEVTEPQGKLPKDPAAPVKYELTGNGRNGAKVFLTLIAHLTDLMTINEKCLPAGTYNKRVFEESSKNPVAKHLKTFGYDTPSSSEKAVRDLRCDITGIIIGALLTTNSNNYLFDQLGRKEGKLRQLYDNLDLYYQVCHLTSHPKPRHPSSVCDMLMWLTGLPHTSIYRDLPFDGFSSLFDKPKKPEPKDTDELALEDIDEDAPSFTNLSDLALEAYPKAFTAQTLADSLALVCSKAETVLISILGYGHADGVYACDFFTNASKLAYPSSAAKCLDVLVELLYRLFHQLRFVYEQCSNSTQYSGWAECYYGQGVGGSSWKCNTKQCADQKCKQIADQSGKQKCELHPKCGVKSPLQSFLEDGLPGFLPHPYSKADCKLSCSAPNHFGKPCKTPMGFADISITASHTSKGSRLYKILKDFCGTSSAPLSVLCSSLVCVLGRPPQTLGDMFAVFQRFLYEWSSSGAHRKDAFDDAVNNANFKRHYENLNAHQLFHSTHSSRIGNHANGDLVSLVCSSKSRLPCGPYLRSLSHDISGSFSMKHADKYVSWVVHITGTLYDLLKKLYDDCNKSCGGDRPKCRIAKCSPTCNVGKQYGTPSHDSKCSSIVNCQSTASVLCTYGFIYSDRMSLSGTKTTEGIRTCKDLCEMLKTVLEEESVLMKLFHSIDKFIYAIRFPFMTLTLALWLLSLLYLIHIMVIRLDLLHIKSHLHSPSSHRIAAQSLLAAARVSKLNRVFYLQP